ncbi:hypothetical protein LWI28_021849 [Acer negundo]|uniref:Pentatricopeptide repeat-containing protein n=1 Tax=Acer negundo TaxID=4023 RepID=A0AAD5IFH6_ACENE|nr:hypothetical protein LWI28_021849 [Acer negundo]
MYVTEIVSWTAMIGRYFEEGRREEGFVLFSKLMKSGIRPNEFTFAGVLNACVDHAAEELGKQRVFDGIPRPDIVSWTALIIGYAQNGLPDKALEYFDLLLKSGTQPDQIVFFGVLSACTHAGLVDKVDLLARSGRFEEAEGIISKMPTKLNKFFWASLHGGCRIHGNLELAKQAVEALFEIQPENPATYMACQPSLILNSLEFNKIKYRQCNHPSFDHRYSNVTYICNVKSKDGNRRVESNLFGFPQYHGKPCLLLKVPYCGPDHMKSNHVIIGFGYYFFREFCDDEFSFQFEGCGVEMCGVHLMSGLELETYDESEEKDEPHLEESDEKDESHLEESYEGDEPHPKRLKHIK